MSVAYLAAAVLQPSIIVSFVRWCHFGSVQWHLVVWFHCFENTIARWRRFDRFGRNCIICCNIDDRFECDILCRCWWKCTVVRFWVCVIYNGRDFPVFPKRDDRVEQFKQMSPFLHQILTCRQSPIWSAVCHVMWVLLIKRPSVANILPIRYLQEQGQCLELCPCYQE